MNKPMRALLRSSYATAAVLLFSLQVSGAAFAAGTAPGITISNSASATYTDSNGTSYTTNSNTVATVVQNAPSLTVTPGAAQTVAPGQTVVDPFVLTNTGNASGNFQLTADTAPLAPSNGGAFVGYYIPGDPVCTAANPCAMAALNTELNAIAATAPGGTVTVDEVYTAGSAGTLPAQTVTATLTQPATVANGAIAATPAATSTPVAATETDTVSPQARLDIQKSVGNFTGTAPIPFTIVANNGGAFGATDLTSAQTFINAGTPSLGLTTKGVLVTDKIPAFNGAPLVLSGAATATLAAATTNAGQTATVYYSTSATGPWSVYSAATEASANPYQYIAVYVTGGTAGVEFPSKPTQSTGAGAVSTPELTLTFSVAQPAGNGAANANSISNIANSVIGGNPNANGSVPVVGPGIPAGTPDSTTANLNPAVTNTAPSTGITAPGGASNTVTTQAIGSNTVVNGPYNNAAATGSYPAPPNNGTAQPTNQLDFTSVGYVCSNGAPNGPTAGCTVPATGTITVPGVFTNTGNASDNFTVSVTAPPGFTAQVFPSTCTSYTGNTPPAGATSVQGIACTNGTTPLTPSTTATNATATGATPLTVASGTSQQYEVVYTPIPGYATNKAFTPIDSTVTVAGTQGAVGTPGTDSNVTHVDLYPGGAIQLTKAYATACNGATTFTASGPVAPGCKLQYTVTYTNVVPASSYTGGANAGTEPAFAVYGVEAGTFVITEDGGSATTATASGNNWFQYSVNGLDLAPTATQNGAAATDTYAYFGPTGTAVGAFSTTAPGISKFTATVPALIKPGTTGTVTFQVTVK